MKKQTEILTKTLTRPIAGRIEWIFLVVVAAVVYRNQENRRLPSAMPPNAPGFVKQTLQSIVSESEKLVGKLANFFYNVTSESFNAAFQLVAIAGLVVLLALAIVYIIRTN